MRKPTGFSKYADGALNNNAFQMSEHVFSCDMFSPSYHLPRTSKYKRGIYCTGTGSLFMKRTHARMHIRMVQYQ